MTQVLRLEELELVGDLMHLALLFERERLLHPGEGEGLHVHCKLFRNDLFALRIELLLTLLDAGLRVGEAVKRKKEV